MKKVAFLLLGNSNIGGAEKRFVSIFNYFIKQKYLNYFVITNSERLKSLYDNNYLIDSTNVFLVDNIVPETATISNNIQQKKKTIPKFIRNIIWKIRKWVDIISITIKINRILLELNIDIAHTIWLGSFSMSLLKLFKSHPKHILTYMDVSFSNVSKNPVDLPISYALTLKTADHIDFLGKSYLNGLEERGFRFDKEKISISDCSFIDYSKCFVTKKENLVVFVARLIDHKNPMLFLEVAKYICLHRNDIKFELCGNGSLEGKIETYIKQNNLKKSISLKYYNDIHQVFAKSKIFVSLQNTDNYPSQAILEAMASENVVIATNVGETYKLVTDEIGYRTSFDPVEIAEIIIYLIDNPLVLKSKAKLANKFVRENHTVDRFGKYLMRIYDKFE